MIARLVAIVARSLAALPRSAAVLAAIAWMAFVWFLSSGPRDLLPSFWPFQVLSNAAHGPVFGVLAVLAARGAEPRARAAWIGFAIAVVYGAADEWHQSTVPGRSASLADWLTDAIGAAGALWLVALADDGDGARRSVGLVGAAILAAASLATLADRLG